MYKFLITRKIYLSKTISLPSLRYYKSLLQNGQSLSLLSFAYAAKNYFLSAYIFPYEKSSYGVRTFLHNIVFACNNGILLFSLAERSYNRPHSHYKI